MAGLFISYRRDDSKGSVGHLYEFLNQYFDENEIHIDGYTIKPGEDFVTAVDNAVGSCSTLISVIGPQWLDICDKQGNQQLSKPNDYVRLEIVSAFKRNIQVVPVLVEGARMPGGNDLSDDLVALARLTPIELNHERFADDVERLVQRIGGATGKIGIHLGESYRGLVKTRMMNHNIIFEIQIDGKKVGQIEKPMLTFGRNQPSDGKTWQSIFLQVEAGVHRMLVVYCRSEFDQGKRSDEVTFRLKGGQTIQFVIEHETLSNQQARIIIKPT